MADEPAVNPFADGTSAARMPEASTLVIFGATGDLTRRKLLPSLFVMQQEGVLPPDFCIVGFARRSWDNQIFRAYVREALSASLGAEPDPEAWAGFAEQLFFAAGEFDHAPAYAALADQLHRLDRQRASTGNRLFYLAAPPSAYPAIIQGLGEAGLAAEGGPWMSGASAGWSRIVVEKPFGHDHASAVGLSHQLLRWFREDQIYRIDHYLGKETVQNILVFRLANGIFEPVWNRQWVDHVQITVAEDVGVGTRGAYFEETGQVRDMIQNHVLQLLALVAMEPPTSFAAAAVRDERAKVLNALRPLDLSGNGRTVLRGQYTNGFVGGERVPAYRQENGVSANSAVETFVALKVGIDNWRWAGVPFYLRAGKRLAKRATEIAIEFKRPPIVLFDGDPSQEPEPNVLAMNIQPDEGISLKIGSKLPGARLDIRPVHMDFRYGTSFGRRSPEAYERLLLDSLLGDATLFSREDSVDAAWRFVDPLLRHWAADGEGPPAYYPAGSWGPEEAVSMMNADGRRWRRL
jgi:glucose-6-phosphate 1-dehydrogenase